jgi:hypothetical protein
LKDGGSTTRTTIETFPLRVNLTELLQKTGDVQVRCLKYNKNHIISAYNSASNLLYKNNSLQIKDMIVTGH